MTVPNPIDNPIPAGDCWFEVYDPYAPMKATPPKATKKPLTDEEALALTRRLRNEARQKERDASRASPYLQVKMMTDKSLQKKLKAIFNE